MADRLAGALAHRIALGVGVGHREARSAVIAPVSLPVFALGRVAVLGDSKLALRLGIVGSASPPGVGATEAPVPVLAQRIIAQTEGHEHGRPKRAGHEDPPRERGRKTLDQAVKGIGIHVAHSLRLLSG
jgi:hypothetical protein